MSLTVGDQVGRIVGAPPGSTVMHLNVTLAEGVVLSCFDFTPPRNRIVYQAADFPSVRYVLQAHAARGAELLVAGSCEELVEALDEHNRRETARARG